DDPRERSHDRFTLPRGLRVAQRCGQRARAECPPSTRGRASCPSVDGPRARRGTGLRRTARWLVDCLETVRPIGPGAVNAPGGAARTRRPIMSWRRWTVLAVVVGALALPSLASAQSEVAATLSVLGGQVDRIPAGALARESGLTGMNLVAGD